MAVARFLHLAGLVPYDAAHALQRALLAARLQDRCPDTVLLLEHAETITVGRARDAARNVVAPAGVPVVAVERGGDVTWHGPGQLVAYPIIRLEGHRQDLHAHLRALEDAVMAVIGGLGLVAVRDDRNTGVWLPQAEGLPQKVCSVGIACRRWVTWHGLALNVSPDLDRFRQIRPCGFDPEVMTRLSDHLQPPQRVQGLVGPLAAALAQALALPAAPVQTLSVVEALELDQLAAQAEMPAD